MDLDRLDYGSSDDNDRSSHISPKNTTQNFHFVHKIKLPMLPVIATFVLFCVSTSVAARGQESVATQSIQAIVHDIKSWQKKHSLSRPFVTVTYAQSIDGKIGLLLGQEGNEWEQEASGTSSNFALSDPESLRMTHALRSIHDAILVGGRTLSVDNPRLNNRLWNSINNGENQPRPIILDTHLTHIRKLGSGCRAQNILVCCSHEAAAEVSGEKEFPELLPCPVSPDTGRIDLSFVLAELRATHHIESIMVEGGASVLTEFYSRPDLMDCLCITVAPKLLLWSGLSAISNTCPTTKVQEKKSGNIILDVGSFESSKFQNLGRDSIFLAKLHHSLSSSFASDGCNNGLLP